MKKVFTLVASFMLVAATFAQGGHGQKNGSYGNDRDVVYNSGPYKNDNHRNDYYSFSIRERDQQVAAINREYDRKLQQAKFKMFMNPYKRTGLIRQLEAQRNYELSIVYAKFNSPRNVFGDGRHNRSDRNDRNDHRY